MGIIHYYDNVSDCNVACKNLIKEAESQNELILGFDMEWPVDFRTGSGKTALIQICPEEQTCYLFHVGCMETLPEALTHLLQHSKVRLVGLNIKNDLWKLSRDFQIIVKPIIDSRVVDLSEFANKVLNSGQTWSLDRLTLHLRSLADDTVRKSNWMIQNLSKTQQCYAATDAYQTTMVALFRIGQMSYGSALRLQKLLEARHKESKNDIHDVLILVEHTPVYTIGIRSKDYSKEVEDKLVSLGADFHRTNRGGLITFHGPGQLVVYPILNLKNYQPSVRWYVNKIEQTVIDVCKELNIEAQTSPHTGVWVEDRKICAVGIHGSRYVTTHGLALNCNTDLNWFSHIVPCGIEGKEVTSLTKELKTDFTIQDTIPIFLNSFSKLFQCSLSELYWFQDLL
ncbi:hypothetical protein L9F63_006086, partial [Diploptera punctata]